MRGIKSIDYLNLACVARMVFLKRNFDYLALRYLVALKFIRTRETED